MKHFVCLFIAVFLLFAMPVVAESPADLPSLEIVKIFEPPLESTTASVTGGTWISGDVLQVNMTGYRQQGILTDVRAYLILVDGVTAPTPVYCPRGANWICDQALDGPHGLGNYTVSTEGTFVYHTQQYQGSAWVIEPIFSTFRVYCAFSGAQVTGPGQC